MEADKCAGVPTICPLVPSDRPQNTSRAARLAAARQRQQQQHRAATPKKAGTSTIRLNFRILDRYSWRHTTSFHCALNAAFSDVTRDADAGRRSQEVEQSQSASTTGSSSLERSVLSMSLCRCKFDDCALHMRCGGLTLLLLSNMTLSERPDK